MGTRVPVSLSWPCPIWAVQSTTSLGPENTERRSPASLHPCGGWRLAQGKERSGGRGPASPLTPSGLSQGTVSHKEGWCSLSTTVCQAQAEPHGRT